MKKENHSESVCLDAAFKDKIINGLLTCQGHIAAIAKMVTQGKSCEDILMQITAVDGALKKIGKQFLINHLEHCVKEGVENQEEDALSSFSKMLNRYLLN